MDAPDTRHDDDFGTPAPPGSEGLLDDVVRGLEADAALGDAADDGPSRAGADSYWNVSRTPLTSLVFTMPLVLAYEGGVLLMGRGSPRNGADVWLRQLLDAAGFGAYFLLPALTVIGLLAWHHVEHDRWRVRPGILAGMALESLVWAAVLLGLARLQGRWWPLAAALEGEGLFARLVAFCGAGLYEEVLFRLLLLPAIAWLMSQLGCSTAASACWGVVASSVLFSAAHYIGPLGDAFTLYSFTFRFLAGLFFAILFVARGFGIAAGTHAVYDILVGLV
jgi:membrane protease YdiL (CAAX protease family)